MQFMKRINVIPILLIAALLGGLALFSRQPSFPPVVGGMTARNQLLSVSTGNYSDLGKAEKAFIEAGTSAMPELVYLVRSMDNPIHVRLHGRFGKHFPNLINPPRAHSIRARSAAAIGLLGKNAFGATPALLAAMGDDYMPVANEARRALSRIGVQALPIAIEVLDTGPEEARAAAAELLGSSEGMIIHLNPEIRRSLLAGLDVDDTSLLNECMKSLGKVGLGSSEEVERLTPFLFHSDTELRAETARTLGLCGMASGDALSSLKLAFTDRSSRVRFEAARSFWLLSRRAPPALPVLQACLHHPETRWQAILALGQMGSDAIPALPALMEEMKSERMHRPFRTPPATAFAVGNIGPAALPHLYQGILDPDPKVRICSALAIGYMKWPDKEPAARLQDLLTDKEMLVRHAAAYGLANKKIKAPAMTSVLTDMLYSEDDYLRSLAMDSLRNVAPEVAYRLKDLE